MNQPTDEEIKDIKERFDEILSWSIDNPDHSESELVSQVVKTGIIEELGYEEIGQDYRVDKTQDKSAQRPDIRAIDNDTGVVNFVIEIKRANRDDALETHEDQLQRYMTSLRSSHGILFNGELVIFYKRDGLDDIKEEFRKRVTEISDDKVEKIVNLLSKDAYSLNEYSDVESFISEQKQSKNTLELSDTTPRANFYDDFALKTDSSFRHLVIDIGTVFKSTIDNSDFTESAYDYWLRSYPRISDPEDAPDWWKPIINEIGFGWSDDGIQKFMFCLETSYSLFSRLILFKATSDYNVPSTAYGESFLDTIQPISQGEEIPPGAWVLSVDNALDQMRQQLIEGVFEEDIFYWWTDNLEAIRDKPELLSRESGDIGDIVEDFTPLGESLRNIILSLHKYDFTGLAEDAGDPLGNLYQNYFDPETRKALGEFYTPSSVVEYMLDSVSYTGAGVDGSRLIDPACGSGTFIVSALERYLDGVKYRAEREGWGSIIEELCNELKIVGFDVHPFAVMMSQVQFMLVLTPKYKEALEESGQFNPTRLPIFRTNTLEDIGQTRIGSSENTVLIKNTLPVKDEDGENIEIEFQFPRHSTIVEDGTNIDIYII